MPYANSPEKEHFVCPNCGADVPPRALACPECGADEQTGWREDGYAGGGSADPEDDFDYEDAFDKEFGTPAKAEGVKTIWWITGIIVVALFVFGALRSIL